MKKTAATGIALGALLLAACSDASDEETTDPPEDPTITEVPTDDPTADPTEDPTDDPTDEPTEDPTTPEGQRAEAVPFDASVNLPTMNEIPAVITWETPGETLHVYTQGSSTPGCYAAPIDAWTDGETMEIAFEPLEPGRTCTTDLVTHAWEITWDEPFEVTGPMSMTLTDILGLGQTFEDVELPPEPTEPIA